MFEEYNSGAFVILLSTLYLGRKYKNLKDTQWFKINI